MLSATAALTLVACGSNEGSGGNGKTAEADLGSPALSTPSATPESDRPRIHLPADLSYTFEWPRTGDTDQDAVLADVEQSIKAVDLAIVNQDPLDKAYLRYHVGEAAAATQKFIQAYVDENARVTGAYRFYAAVVDVRGESHASFTYCEDQGKAYDMYLNPKKIDKTAVTKNSYVLYSTKLSKNADGVWVVEQMSSERGSESCQP
ncbi:hypothetical protein KVH17_03020 [Streptomyces olivaceus]|nr:hypothetical protein [Streptomyces olivaceus]